MIYITGDTHSDFERFERFCEENKTTADDIMIILGDVGLNYFNDQRDKELKEKAAGFPLTFFCIHGNHEMRPADVGTYVTKEFHGGTVWYEEEFPSLLFARDGDVFNFDGHECLVIGGAYSIDKYWRLLRGWKWFANEQPDNVIKARVEERLARRGDKVDVVLSHTCPVCYEPVDVFFKDIDQSMVDKSTEMWLGMVEFRLNYKKWYCGHYHISRARGKMRFMYEEIEPFSAQ